MAVVASAMRMAASMPADDVAAGADADAKAALVDQLTLDEKVEQLLNTAPAIPRLKIPAYNWWTESLHGAMGPLPTTNFPEPIGLAASFDAALVREVAAAISVEVRALHALGRKTGTARPHRHRAQYLVAQHQHLSRSTLGPRTGNIWRGSIPHGAAWVSRYVHGMQGPIPDRP